jgi:hypothetical protein
MRADDDPIEQVNMAGYLAGLIFLTPAFPDYLALRHNTHEIYYYTTPTGYEVDFYLPESDQLIQVAQSMDNPATREREIRALLDGMAALSLSSGLILADSNNETTTRNGFTIKIRSLAEWLLESE